MEKKKESSKRLKILRNRKVAESRGKSWLSKLGAGKFEARYNPTLLRTLRVERGWNQERLAELIDSSQASYGAIERSHRFITGKKAAILAQKLSVPLSKLFKNVKGEKYLALLARGSGQ